MVFGNFSEYVALFIISIGQTDSVGPDRLIICYVKITREVAGVMRGENSIAGSMIHKLEFGHKDVTNWSHLIRTLTTLWFDFFKKLFHTLTRYFF